jgi:hypothetical protein
VTRPARLAIAGALWLALFSTLFSIGSAFHLWPDLPGHLFANWDLYAGLAFGVVLLAALAAAGGRKSVG